MIIPIAPVISDKAVQEEVRKALLNLAAQINRKHEEDFLALEALSARFGGPIDYTSFASDGTLRQFGTARNWKDLILPAANLRPGPVSPVYADFLGGIYAPRFDAGGAVEELYGSFEMQHDYFEGSDLYFHLHWTPTTTNTGNIVWGVSYTVAKPFTVFPAPTTVLGTPTAAPGVVSQHQLQNIAIIPGAGLTIGTVVAFRVFRQSGGTDTFTGNAFLHSVGVHYSADSLGSKGIFTKEL
jgi:hypothetical protein